jgi:outer membrane immunogenic protein
MRRLAAIFVLLALGQTGVSAADMAVKARPLAVDPAYDWSGFYVGAGIGWQRDEARWETTAIGNPPLAPAAVGRVGLGGPIATFNADQFRLAGYAGYNVQLNRVVVGVEGDIATGFDNKKTLNYIPGTVFGPPGGNTPLGDVTTVEHLWNGSVRGRIGYLATPRLLIYGTAGLALEEERDTLFCPGSINNSRWCVATRSQTNSKILAGWTAGAGIEGVVSGNWLARAEYRYSDLGSFSSSYFIGTNTDEVYATTRLRTSTVTLGLAYKFGGPVVAKY